MTHEEVRILTEIKTTVERMDHELFGNGQPGQLATIKSRIEVIEEFKSVIKGALATFGVLFGLLTSAVGYHLIFGGK